MGLTAATITLIYNLDALIKLCFADPQLESLIHPSCKCEADGLHLGHLRDMLRGRSISPRMQNYSGIKMRLHEYQSYLIPISQ
jgi:hypothetical protein